MKEWKNLIRMSVNYFREVDELNGPNCTFRPMFLLMTQSTEIGFSGIAYHLEHVMISGGGTCIKT